MNTRQWLAKKWPAVASLALVVVVMLTWRIVLWPGSITHDGLWVLEGAETGAVTTYHPYLNSLLARWLVIPFGTIGVFTSLQTIFCLAVLGSIFFRLFARTGRPWLVLAIGVLFSISIPTGLYLGMFWKDVPFAFAVLFIAFSIYDLKGSQDVVERGRGFWLLLCLSMVFVTFLRHGYLFNLLLVPAALYYRCGARMPALACLTASLAAWAFMAASSATWLQVRNDEAHITRVQLLTMMQPFLAVMSAPGAYVSDDPVADRALLDEVFVADAVERYNPKYGDVTLIRPAAELPADARVRLVRRVATLCILNVSKCAGDRVQLFLAALFPTDPTYGMTFYDLGMYEGTCPHLFGISPNHCDILDFYVARNKPNALDAAAHAAVERIEQRTDWLRRLLLWNGVIGLGTLLCVLLLFGTSHPLWWSAAFLLVQCLVPIAASTASDFRYYFQLHVWGLVFLPILLHTGSAALARRSQARRQGPVLSSATIVQERS